MPKKSLLLVLVGLGFALPLTSQAADETAAEEEQDDISPMGNDMLSTDPNSGAEGDSQVSGIPSTSLDIAPLQSNRPERRPGYDGLDSQSRESSESRVDMSAPLSGYLDKRQAQMKTVQPGIPLRDQ